MRVANTSNDWERRTAGGRNAITNYSLRYVVSPLVSIDAEIVPQCDRVDPTEFQPLKGEPENLRTKKSAMETQQTTQAGNGSAAGMRGRLFVSYRESTILRRGTCCVDHCVGENEQRSRGDCQEQPDFSGAHVRFGCQKFSAQFERRSSPERVRHDRRGVRFSQSHSNRRASHLVGSHQQKS